MPEDEIKMSGIESMETQTGCLIGKPKWKFYLCLPDLVILENPMSQFYPDPGDTVMFSTRKYECFHHHIDYDKMEVRISCRPCHASEESS